ncbi:uncharacterized protein SCHCODRAFT_02545520 [Schizophyllum commune H4-8]|uniref:uncharacterized protein n=1 Tax=Schizophyllum commune (strain H4-8 / FGSC 9210) TaxID=578458 RepID=UPI002160320A|nr:uncharacterized protein SCHCODRAFT_02545520 [Schizophyllum commune H4-8]KAI5891786.1 hypothetical protein SCHCODRAFT_02545520 [Schizophyllum commune H4-8]
MGFGDKKVYFPLKSTRKLGLSSIFRSKRKAKPLSLFDFPNEIIERIVSLSLPLDIIVNLRRTCKAVSEMTLNRLLWVHIVDVFLDENRILLPPDHLEDLPVDKLERLVFLPVFALRHYQAATPQTVFKNLDFDELYPQSDIPIRKAFPDRDAEATHLTLIAGGRYLLAQHENFRRNEVHLMLLSGVDEGDVVMTEVAKFNIPLNTHSGRIHDYWLVKRSRSVLRFCARESLKEERVYQISVYEIDTAAEVPQFTTLARTTDFGSIFAPQSTLQHCGEDRIAFCDENVAVLWDFVRDQRVELSIPGPDSHITYVLPTIKVVDDRVMYIQRHLFAIFVLPRDASGVLGPLKPAFLQKFSGQCNLYFPHPATPRPFVFHVLHRTFTKLRTYELPAGSGVPKEIASRSIPKSPLWWQIYGPASVVSVGGAHVAVRILPKSCRDVLWIDLERGGREGKPLAGSVRLMFEDSGGLGDNCSFDPLSGRLVVAKYNGTLRVIDYV